MARAGLAGLWWNHHNREMERARLRSLEWVGSSRKDLRSFPGPVRDHLGFALFQAQAGTKHRDAKPLRGLGSGVLEVVSSAASGTYRAVYLVRFEKAVYVLHAFQKKSKSGIATPQAEIDLAKARLASATAHYASVYGKD